MIPDQGFEILCVEAAHFSRFNAGLGEAHSEMGFVGHRAAVVVWFSRSGAANFKAHARAILRHGSIERGGRMKQHGRCAAHARGHGDASCGDEIKSARGRAQIRHHASRRFGAQTFFKRPEQILRAGAAHINEPRQIKPVGGQPQPIGRTRLAGGKFIADENERRLRLGRQPRAQTESKTARRRMVAHARGRSLIKRAGKEPAQRPVERARRPLPPERRLGEGGRGRETPPSLFKARERFAEKADPVRAAVCRHRV